MEAFVQCDNEGPHSAHHWTRKRTIVGMTFNEYGWWCPGLKMTEEE